MNLNDTAYGKSFDGAQLLISLIILHADPDAYTCLAC